MFNENGSIRTLSVDIGGSGVKAMVLDITGNPVTERARLDTPQPATPEVVINAIVVLAAAHGEFHRVSVGFPGVVRCGVTETAVNLHPDWIGFDLETALLKHLNKPVRVINDADMQGFGAIAGKGVELVIFLSICFFSGAIAEEEA